MTTEMNKKEIPLPFFSKIGNSIFSGAFGAVGPFGAGGYLAPLGTQVHAARFARDPYRKGKGIRLKVILVFSKTDFVSLALYRESFHSRYRSSRMYSVPLSFTRKKLLEV